jgi:hypothetical protein
LWRDDLDSHFAGRLGACYWAHLDDADCVLRLEVAPEHEKLASLFIQYKEFVGHPISTWDWTALQACILNCSLFKQLTLQQAESLQLCSPTWDEVELQPNKSLAEVGVLVRDVRNSMLHYMILSKIRGKLMTSIEFHRLFKSLVLCAAALGGNVGKAHEIRQGSQVYFPAQNTLEEVKQYELTMNKVTILTHFAFLFQMSHALWIGRCRCANRKPI